MWTSEKSKRAEKKRVSERQSSRCFLQIFLVPFPHHPGPGCSKLGQDNPGLVRNLNSDLKVKK